jgi:hypothetical protein
LGPLLTLMALDPHAPTKLADAVLPHLAIPGTSGAMPDPGGMTYGAHVWRSGEDRLLGFQTFC